MVALVCMMAAPASAICTGNKQARLGDAAWGPQVAPKDVQALMGQPNTSVHTD